MEFTSFGRYRLIELLGRHWRYELWRGHDTEIGRAVALQVLPCQVDEVVELRFRREAAILARVEHPHLLPVYEVAEMDGRVYLATRLVTGVSLQRLLAAGPLAPARAVAIVEQIAAALHATHQAGLVHRYLKSSRILVGDDDSAYLTGFDLGVALTPSEDSGSGDLPSFETFAPERFTGDGTTAAGGDVYALACVLYQCLTGELPFRGASLEEMVRGHVLTPPPRPSESRVAVPATMDEVVATGMAKDPALRYQTAVDLATAARAALAPESAASPLPATPDEPTRHGRDGRVLKPISSVAGARAAIADALFKQPRTVLIDRRLEREFVETVFPGPPENKTIYACRDETVTGATDNRSDSPTPAFDVFQKLVHPDYPLLGIFITQGIGSVESTTLDDQLLAYYSAAYGTAAYPPAQPQSLISGLTFLEPTAIIDTGEIAPGIGVVVPQLAGATPTVYRLSPRPERGVGPLASIRMTKFVVPHYHPRSLDALISLGFERWMPYWY